MAPELKYTDEQLAEKIIFIQMANPLHTKAKICNDLDVDRDYLNDRSKKSDLILRAIKKADAIREEAWVEKGFTNMGDKEMNATMYIWMTRNILGWNDKPHVDSVTQTKDGKLIIDLSGDHSNKKE